MQEIDKDIKKALQNKMQRIEDDAFTKRIIDMHMAKKQEVKYRPFANFLSIIIGISTFISSIGFMYVLKQRYDWFNEIGISEKHGLILIVISFIFLIYKLIEEITAPNTQYKKLGGMC